METNFCDHKAASSIIYKCSGTVLIVKKEFTMSNENKHKNRISLWAVVLGAILAGAGYLLPSGLGQSIVVNIASNFISTGVFSFFILDRILSAQENKNQRFQIARDKEAAEISQQKIEVFLWDEDSKKRFNLPLELLRGEFNRGELLARIGMLPMQNTGSRFAFEYTGNRDFLREINKITTNKSNELKISCNSEEIKQFKMYEKYMV
jgi:hypothetical protein